MNFRTVISNTLERGYPKSIRRVAKIGHLKPENAPNALPMQVWSMGSPLEKLAKSHPPLIGILILSARSPSE